VFLFLFVVCGFGACFIYYAFVYESCSGVFWPLSSQEVGIMFFSSYSRDFFSVADGEVFGIGILLLLLAVGTSIRLNRTGWVAIPVKIIPLPRAPLHSVMKIVVVFRSFVSSR